MDIIDIVSQVPGLNIEGNRGVMQKGYKCEIYDSKDDTTPLCEWALNICREIVAKNNIDVNDIGVIINSSVCLYETTSKRNTSAPGLGYHIQKHLNSSSAFVFELFHSDWGNMIQIACNFLSKTQCQYSILMQTNKLTNTLKDYENGFTIPDGVSVFLIKNTNNTLILENYPLGYEKAKLEFNMRNEDMLKNNILFKLEWSYNDLLVNGINDKFKNIESSLIDEGIYPIFDRWFALPQNAISYNPEPKMVLAMHTIPWCMLNMPETYKTNSSYALVSFNPFLSYYSVLKILRQ